MANILVPFALLMYIVAATIGVSLYIGTGSQSQNTISNTLHYGASAINNFLQNNSTTNLKTYVNTENGAFAWNENRGLYATNLDYIFGIGYIAQCQFGGVNITNNIVSESYRVSNITVSSSDNIGILLDYNTNKNGLFGIDTLPCYTWLFISENDVWIQKEVSGSIGGVIVAPWGSGTVIANNLNNGVPLPISCTINYTLNYNNDVLTIYLNNVMIYNKAIDVGMSTIATERSGQIRLNNLNYNIVSTNSAIPAYTNYSENIWDYVGLFFSVAVWGIDNNLLMWYWHILLITLPEIALIVYIIIAAVHG